MNYLSEVEEIKTMSTREIAKLLDKEHSNIKISAERMAKTGTLALQESFFTHNNNQYVEYLLNKRDSIILVAQNCPEFTAVIVDRWQELESKQLDIKAISKKDLALMVIESEEKIEEQAKVIEAQKPAVDFCNKISQTTNSIKIGEFAKIFSDSNFIIGQNKLFQFLREKKILLSDNMPYQKYIDNGWFEVIQGVIENSRYGRTWSTTKITGKGQVAIAKKLIKEYEVA
jgi:phage antirepressor YoqD-like protein